MTLHLHRTRPIEAALSTVLLLAVTGLIAGSGPAQAAKPAAKSTKPAKAAVKSAAKPGTKVASSMVPMGITLPKPVFAGTPSDAPPGTTVEKPSKKPRPIPLVPKGTVNLALNKKVTSSAAPFEGSLDLITDGNKEAREGTAVELKPRLQWVQIDLGASSPLSYILIWHYHMQPIVCHDVVVQVSDDRDFIEKVTTLFNNDQDNSAGLGVGKDREYFETNEGKLVDAKGIKARYVRLYSKGSTHTDPLNRYTEVEVWGQPAKG
ncbi:MAG TPA: discoidin domain-containing protein [Armatimonadota bacterium]